MPLDLQHLELKYGAHKAGKGEYCVMEATAAFLDLPHSDRNVDEVCPRIEAYLRALNDWLPNKERQQLIQFIPRLANTKGSQKQDDKRRWMLQEQATLWASSALRTAKLNDWADKLAQCSITDQTSSKIWAARAARVAIIAESIVLVDQLIKVTEQ